MASLTDSVMQVSSVGTKITTSGTPQKTAAINSPLGQQFVTVRLRTTSACYIEFGADPTATSSSATLDANAPEYFKMNTGDKIGVLQVSAAGTFEYAIMV